MSSPDQSTLPSDNQGRDNQSFIAKMLAAYGVGLILVFVAAICILPAIAVVLACVVLPILFGHAAR